MHPINKKFSHLFFQLAVGYLLFGLLMGLIGSFQYLLPGFLKERIGFQQTRPLHVYLVTAWIFSAAQGAIYFYVQKIKQRPLWSEKLAYLHWLLQLGSSVLIVSSFYMQSFSGREYLEFPVWIGIIVLLAWLAFGINILLTLKPNYKKAPVYYFSWTAGICFFLITFSESYLWQFRFFGDNPVRDVTVQWKAMGAMVGSWNMLVFGAALCSMEMMKNDKNVSHNNLAYAFFFVGFTNLLFNWGHHTYIVPASPWVKQIAYIISMTELILLANIIWSWRKSMRSTKSLPQKNARRFLMFADHWILLNLITAIAISVPALNYFTHGTHITVAHAMGATIGINTMVLFSVIFHIIDEKPVAAAFAQTTTSVSIWVTNVSLVVFYSSLVAAGIIKIWGRLQNDHFAVTMAKSRVFFQLFAISGSGIVLGLLTTCIIVLIKIYRSNKAIKNFIFYDDGPHTVKRSQFQNIT